MEPSSRTPEGMPNLCPVCGHKVFIEPSSPAGDAPCPSCGHLLWFSRMARLGLPLEGSEGDLRLEMVDDVLIVSIGVGLLTEDVNPDLFLHELFALVEQFGCRRIIVNLKEVRTMTSAFLGTIMTMYRKNYDHQAAVIFCNLQEAVADVLRTTRLISLLQVAPDVSSALAALHKDTV